MKSSRKLGLTTLMVSVAGLALLAAACSGKTPGSNSGNSTATNVPQTPVPTATAAASPTTPPAATATPASTATTMATPSGSGSTSIVEEMGDNFFKLKTVTIPANKPITLTVKNDGQAVHTWTLIDKQGFTGTTDTGVMNPGESKTITFTATKPGTYKFHCAVHPTEMTGTIVVQ